MTIRSLIAKVSEQEELNFLVTNRIPRRSLSRLMGWLSRIEQPLVRDVSIGIWRLFSDLDLSDAKKARFRSMHDCFTRELRAGARPIDLDPAVLVSPCDAIVGASGAIDGDELLQVKGSCYRLTDLLGETDLVDLYRGGRYVTLRLTSSMYHRFHAPHDCRVEEVTHIPGDTFNVNPIALKRVEKLFCRNERAVIRTRLASGQAVTLVPVAAILVAGIRLNFLDDLRDANRQGRKVTRCNAEFRKGAEMGLFEHGSTIIVLAPGGFALTDNVAEGGVIRVGEPLMRLPGTRRQASVGA